jgi:hypothetical protein
LTWVVELLAEWDVDCGGVGASLDSNTSRPFSFWFSTASGWNLLAFCICDSNQFLTSSCSSSTRFWWLSSRCLAGLAEAWRQERRAAAPVQLQQRYLPYQHTVDMSGRRHRQRTISSLHMGHTSRLDALAAAFSLGPSSTLLPMSSLVSAVLAGLLDVCELSDTELSEGARKLALRPWRACGCGEMAGDRFLPLPSTRPPPRDLREAMSRMSKEVGRPWWSAGIGRLGVRVVAGAVTSR